jgi:hypothetical protein
MADQLEVTTIDGYSFVVDADAGSDGETWARALLRDGATEHHEDGSFTIHAPGRLAQVTVWPDGVERLKTQGFRPR